jgi:hypothetical protein
MQSTIVSMKLQSSDEKPSNIAPLPHRSTEPISTQPSLFIHRNNQTILQPDSYLSYAIPLHPLRQIYARLNTKYMSRLYFHLPQWSLYYVRRLMSLEADPVSESMRKDTKVWCFIRTWS